MDKNLLLKIERGLLNLKEPNSVESKRLREEIRKIEHEEWYCYGIKAIKDSDRLSAEDYNLTINYAE